MKLSHSFTEEDIIGIVSSAVKLNSYPRKQLLVAQDPRLGLIDDPVLAKSLRVSKATVWKVRKALGIKSASEIESDIKLELVKEQPDLGKIADSKIAARLNDGAFVRPMTRSFVRDARFSLGVRSVFERKSSRAAPATKNKKTAYGGVCDLMQGWGR